MKLEKNRKGIFELYSKTNSVKQSFYEDKISKQSNLFDKWR